MRKLKLCIAGLALSLTFIPAPLMATADNAPDPLITVKAEEEKKARVLLKRLDEIKAMDKSKLSFPEKKNLRKEVRAIRHDLRSIGFGIYLSGGTLLLIIILLIIFL